MIKVSNTRTKIFEQNKGQVILLSNELCMSPIVYKHEVETWKILLESILRNNCEKPKKNHFNYSCAHKCDSAKG